MASQFPKPTEEMWQNIASKFWEKWNFPNCMGAIDRKHITLVSPAHSGSLYFNYKGTLSSLHWLMLSTDSLFCKWVTLEEQAMEECIVVQHLDEQWRPKRCLCLLTALCQGLERKGQCHTPWWEMRHFLSRHIWWGHFLGGKFHNGDAFLTTDCLGHEWLLSVHLAFLHPDGEYSIQRWMWSHRMLILWSLQPAFSTTSSWILPRTKGGWMRLKKEGKCYHVWEIWVAIGDAGKPMMYARGFAHFSTPQKAVFPGKNRWSRLVLSLSKNLKIVLRWTYRTCWLVNSFIFVCGGGKKTTENCWKEKK